MACDRRRNSESRRLEFENCSERRRAAEFEHEVHDFRCCGADRIRVRVLHVASRRCHRDGNAGRRESNRARRSHRRHDRKNWIDGSKGTRSLNDMDSETFYHKPETTEEFLAFYERLKKKNAAPLWESLAELVPVKPRPRSVPTIWRYDEIRPFLMESGKLITAKLAERRVLMLENPGMRGTS